MNSGSFLKSAIAAIGRPQFATGPQKCCDDGSNLEEMSVFYSQMDDMGNELLTVLMK